MLRWKRILARLRGDFELGILTLFGSAAVLGIFPFAVYRFARGDLWIGLADLAIVLGILAAVSLAWWRGDTRRAGIFMVISNTLGSMAITYAFGHHGLAWVYVVLVTNFFLADRRVALLANVALLAVVWLRPASFISALEHVTFGVTSAMVCLFTYLFAYRTATQRALLERLASQDPLTGAGNRRLLEQELERAVAIRRRHGRPFGLAVLDLDHFKQINDSYGHEAGDRVLADFVALVQLRTRRSDRVFRLGGEEFVLLMSDTDREAMRRALENTLEVVRHELRSPGGPVRVSIGAAELGAEESWPEWLARADAAMYRAKRAGRDRLELDPPDD
jgi:diguanylate cyclase (GGDEF)-like protein